MESELVKQIANAGMGLGSLLVLAVLFVYQLKTNGKMFDKFGENIDKNTEVMNEMTKTLVSINEINRQMVETSARCKAVNQFNSK